MSTKCKVELPQDEIEALLQKFPQGVVAIDLETTGLSPLLDKIVELSAIKVTPTEVEIFDQLIDPKITILDKFVKIHGIDNSMVEGKPEIQTVLPQFIEFVGDLPIIAHNARFDLGFIIFNIHNHNLELPKSKIYCSCQFARKAFKRADNHKLGTLAEELEIPLINHHRAFDDAVVALRIFAKGLVEGYPRIDISYLYSLGDFSKTKDFEVPEHLELIKEKLESQEEVEILYSGGSHKGVFRPIKPVGFLPMPRGAILYAHCLLSDQFKSFALRKIVEVREK